MFYLQFWKQGLMVIFIFHCPANRARHHIWFRLLHDFTAEPAFTETGFRRIRSTVAMSARSALRFLCQRKHVAGTQNLRPGPGIYYLARPRSAAEMLGGGAMVNGNSKAVSCCRIVGYHLLSPCTRFGLMGMQIGLCRALP